MVPDTVPVRLVPVTRTFRNETPQGQPVRPFRASLILA